jgi:diguanylate cyclase (GGDEF)-like protein
MKDRRKTQTSRTLRGREIPARDRRPPIDRADDVVSRFAELEVLLAALHNVEEGIILLDPQLRAQFMNRAVRRLWDMPDEHASRRPPITELVNEAHRSGACVLPGHDVDESIRRRIAMIEIGDPRPLELHTRDGRIIRSRCAALPDGGRMLIYSEVTDLIRNAKELELLATIDSMTGVCNRRHFLVLAEAEWTRFQRYHRPFSLAVFDIDRFKSINDGFGQDVGDRAIGHVCHICTESKRASDTIGRVGGDEFAVLLPETDAVQAEVVAERLRSMVQDNPLVVDGAAMPLTISVGLAPATLSQSSFDALMKVADRALYQAKARGRNRVAHAPGTPPPALGSAAE